MFENTTLSPPGASESRYLDCNQRARVPLYTSAYNSRYDDGLDQLLATPGLNPASDATRACYVYGTMCMPPQYVFQGYGRVQKRDDEFWPLTATMIEATYQVILCSRVSKRTRDDLQAKPL